MVGVRFHVSLAVDFLADVVGDRQEVAEFLMAYRPGDDPLSPFDVRPVAVAAILVRTSVRRSRLYMQHDEETGLRLGFEIVARTVEFAAV